MTPLDDAWDGDIRTVVVVVLHLASLEVEAVDRKVNIAVIDIVVVDAVVLADDGSMVGVGDDDGMEAAAAAVGDDLRNCCHIHRNHCHLFDREVAWTCWCVDDNFCVWE